MVVSSIALILMLAATILFAIGRYVWDALLLAVIGVGMLTYALARQHRLGHQLRTVIETLLPKDIYSSLRLAGVAISFVVALASRRGPYGGDYTLRFVLWVLAVGVFIAGILKSYRLRTSSFATFSRNEWIGLTGLLLVAFLLRVAAVGSIPHNLGGDEGTQLVEALKMVRNGMRNPFGTGWYSVPTMSFLIPGLWMKLAGATTAGARTLSVLAGTLTVFTTWLAARSMSGKRAGWVAATVVAVSAYHIHFSRLASNQVADPLVGTLVLWLLWQAVFQEQDETRQRALWGFAGLAAGMGWYFYFGARWVSVLVALFALWRVLANRSFLKAHWRGMLRFYVGWLVVVLPLLGWYSVHPSSFTERYNAVSIFASGWLVREVQITGQPAWMILLDQLFRSFTAFHYTPDRSFWYMPYQPLLDVITGALMLTGLIACLVKLRQSRHVVTLGWFISTVVMAWAFTDATPSSQRGLLLVPLVGLIVAWGIEALGAMIKRHKDWFSAGVAVLLLCSAVVNGVFYFAVYSPRNTYGNPTAEIATNLAVWMLDNPEPVCADLGTNPCEGIVYFLGPPRMYWSFGSLGFLLRDYTGEDVPQGEIPPDVKGPARFVLIEQRVDQLAAVQVSYPGGEIADIYNSDGKLLAVVYDWTP